MTYLYTTINRMAWDEFVDDEITRLVINRGLYFTRLVKPEVVLHTKVLIPLNYDRNSDLYFIKFIAESFRVMSHFFKIIAPGKV